MAELQETYDGLEQMPYNLEAEQSVLGAILLEPENLTRVMGELTPECFYRTQHQQIFAVHVPDVWSGQVLDNITIFDEVIKEHIFDTTESAKQYLVQLMEIVPSTANIEVYAKIVREKYYLRALIGAARDIIASAAEGSRERQAKSWTWRNSGSTTSARDAARTGWFGSTRCWSSTMTGCKSWQVPNGKNSSDCLPGLPGWIPADLV